MNDNKHAKTESSDTVYDRIKKIETTIGNLEKCLIGLALREAKERLEEAQKKENTYLSDKKNACLCTASGNKNCQGKDCISWHWRPDDEESPINIFFGRDGNLVINSSWILSCHQKIFRSEQVLIDLSCPECKTKKLI